MRPVKSRAINAKTKSIAMDIGSLSDQDLRELQYIIAAELERRKDAGTWQTLNDEREDFVSLTYWLGNRRRLVFTIVDSEIHWNLHDGVSIVETGLVGCVEDMKAIEAFKECPVDDETYKTQFEMLKLETLDMFG